MNGRKERKKDKESRSLFFVLFAFFAAILFFHFPSG